MVPDRAIGRYRRWYARLLRLYPRHFHEQFAEPMAQTFTDLCRERRQAKRGLHAFAIMTFAATFAQIMRENMTQLTQARTVIRWVLITAAVVAVPLLARVLSNIPVRNPDDGAPTLNWGPMDFAILGILVLGTGLLYEYASARARDVAQRAAVGIAVAAGLLLIWANFAVGMIGDEGNPAYLTYVLVLAVALIGTAIARFEPREASIAMFATAGAHALVAAIAVVAGLGPELFADAVFVAAWMASALLFRQASRPSATSL